MTYDQANQAYLYIHSFFLIICALGHILEFNYKQLILPILNQTQIYYLDVLIEVYPKVQLNLHFDKTHFFK